MLGVRSGAGVVWKCICVPGSASTTLPCEAAAAAICLLVDMVVVGGNDAGRQHFMVC
jgi:hypothetical protein